MFDYLKYTLNPVLLVVSGYGLWAGGNYVWLGTGVIVNPGVTIGRNSVIGAGSVVTKSIPPDVVAAGVPCRVLRPITASDREAFLK